MKTRIIRIGNSKGIRVPKVLLDQAQLPEDVELHAEPGRLVVQAVRGAEVRLGDSGQGNARAGRRPAARRAYLHPL